jgi:hypothetical protein
MLAAIDLIPRLPKRKEEGALGEEGRLGAAK